MTTHTNYIRWFEHLDMNDVALVGGKNASLGEMIQQLTSQGIRVPGGFAITAQGYWHHLRENNLVDYVSSLINDIDGSDIDLLQLTGKKIRAAIAQAPLPQDLHAQIIDAYAAFESRYGSDFSVAMRSSATAEDLPHASFAGQQETALNVRGGQAVASQVSHLMASLFTDRAIIYRIDHGFDHMSVALSVGVQKMVRSDVACSGVIFSLDTESGFADVVYISGSWGVGEYVVQGKVDPDEWYVHKPTLNEGFEPLLKRRIGKKVRKLVFGSGEDQLLKNEEVTGDDTRRFCLESYEVLELSRYACTIENHYSQAAQAWRPMDIEWAKDGLDGKLYIVQARPETVHSMKDKTQKIVSYALDPAQKDAAKVLVSGNSVGDKIAAGRARIINDTSEMDRFEEGEILVSDMTDPDWVPIMKKASGIITNRGGRTCHAAIVSRELGIPAIVGTTDGTTVITDGMPVTLDCSSGVRGTVYDRILTITKTETIIDELPQAPCKIMMNIGNPDEAFKAAMIPNDGVGLARLEFIISSSIQVHPLSLVRFDDVKDPVAREKIEHITFGYPDKKEFFVDTLAQEVGTIAAAFYPKPVIVRLSDFKSNEYRQLIGGSYFEPIEENPMISFRGASRYYHEQYREAFALECAAIKKIRNKMGLTNLKVMVPFVRTLFEAQKVIEVMGEYGLVQGENGLKIIMMCEVPSNVILIDEFSKIFDGFSIGSNDLTQFTLGVDRDSALVADTFNEKDPAVIRMIEMAISGAKSNSRPIGICGQAPSDHPDFAQKLIALGIDSISLISDSVIRTRLSIASE